jgi:hypothetical protein
LTWLFRVDEMALRADDGPVKTGPLEILVTVLLVVAAVATSWSSYQATRWHGEQAQATSRTNSIRIEAARASSLAEAQTEIDVATFIAWVDADQTGNQPLATFFVERFRPEFRAAFEAWLRTDPFSNPDAPKTPFATPEYQLASQLEADELDEAEEASAADVRQYIQIASNYVLTVVLYAVVLFFAGISTKMASRRLRTVMLTAGCVVLAAAIVWVLTLPVSFRI